MNNATCPEVLTADAAETSLGVDIVAFMGTAVVASELKNRVIPEQQQALEDRLQAVGEVIGVILTPSTRTDASPQFDVYTRQLPVLNMGFPQVEDPRHTLANA